MAIFFAEQFAAFDEDEPDRKSKPNSGPQVIIAKEMSLYEISKIRPVNLDKIYNALLTIKPTSVEPERAFSSMGYFVTKLRSLLDDDNVDALIFLRQYYNCNK